MVKGKKSILEGLMEGSVGLMETKGNKLDTLPVAIRKVLNDSKIDDSEKVKRIDAYIEVYFDNKQLALSDVE